MCPTLQWLAIRTYIRVVNPESTSAENLNSGAILKQGLRPRKLVIYFLVTIVCVLLTIRNFFRVKE